MPKSSKTRKVRRPVYPLVVKKTLTVGALVAQDLISSALTDTANDTMYAITLEATWTLNDHTAAEGPIDIGIAHSSYTAAEIEEWMESSGAWDRGDKVTIEQSRRFCRRVGTFPGLATDEVLNDGLPVKTRVRFLIQEGDTFQVFAFNSSSATLTDGSLVKCNGVLWAKNA